MLRGSVYNTPTKAQANAVLAVIALSWVTMGVLPIFDFTAPGIGGEYSWGRPEELAYR